METKGLSWSWSWSCFCGMDCLALLYFSIELAGGGESSAGGLAFGIWHSTFGVQCLQL